MAKLPRIIRNTQDGQMKKLQEGGTATDDSISAGLGLERIKIPEQKTTLTEEEKLTPVTKAVQAGEEVAPIAVGTTPTVTTTATDPTGLEVSTPQSIAAAKYTAYTTEGTPEATAAQGTLSQESKIGDVVGAVSEQSVAQAAQGTVDEKATVKYQLAQLFSSIEEGGELPAWAAPAVRNVSAQMQQRGLGASSMAAAAITQAITEAGIPIAAADAQTYARMELTNLNNKQQTALRNAMTYAAMDTANLNVAATVAATNSKSFLAIDAQNLTQSQQANMLDFQSQVQKLTTDQAQINAAQQFNAKSQNQSDEFFTELGTQIENSNVTRKAAMEQFNADQANASARFVAQLEDSRDKFNANMAGQIDQSNANWRRVINTENTALQNETNRLNAQNLLGLSVQAQNQVWQRYRDEASWVLSRTESATQRAHQYAMQAQSNDFDDQMYQQQFRDSTYQELGKTILDFVFF
jgi:hypothetical protein